MQRWVVAGGHRPELQHGEGPGKQADAFLPKERRAGRAQSDDGRDEQEQRRGERQEQQAAGDVHQPLQGEVDGPAGLGRAKVIQQRVGIVQPWRADHDRSGVHVGAHAQAIGRRHARPIGDLDDQCLLHAAHAVAVRPLRQVGDDDAKLAILDQPPDHAVVRRDAGSGLQQRAGCAVIAFDGDQREGFIEAVGPLALAAQGTAEDRFREHRLGHGREGSRGHAGTPYAAQFAAFTRRWPRRPSRAWRDVADDCRLRACAPRRQRGGRTKTSSPTERRSGQPCSSSRSAASVSTRTPVAKSAGSRTFSMVVTRLPMA